MATKTWVNVTDGDWSAAASWSPSGVPVTADDVVLANNSQSVLAGLDQSLVSLHSLHIDRTYTGNVGSSGSPLQIGVDNGTDPVFINNTGGNELWIDTKVSTGNTIATVVMDTVKSSANVNQLTGKIVDMFCINGMTGVDSSSTISGTVHMIPKTRNAVGPTLTIPSGVTLTNSIFILDGGFITTKTAGTGQVIYCNAGLFEHDGGTVPNAIISGGEYRFLDGTLTLGTIFSGLFDNSRSIKTRTLTKLIAIGENSVVNLRNAVNAGFPASFKRFGQPKIVYSDNS